MAEIVVKDKKDDNVEKALDIVNAQQKIVGKALVGASGATLVEKSEESYEILEHIRQLSNRSLTSLKSIANSLISMFRFDKDEARRKRDQASELAKETPFIGPMLPSNEDVSTNDDRGGDVGKGLGAMAFLGNFFGRLPGVGALKKLFKPILGFFGKSGVLFKIFGRFGPLAGLTLAVGFLIRYIDDIAKALAPVLDGAKAVYKSLEPLLKAIMEVVDVFVKGALVSVGASLKIAMGLVVASVETFMNSLKFVAALLKGLFTLDFQLIKDAFMEFISLDAFVKIFKKLGATIGDAFKGLINGIGEIFGFDKLFDFVSQLFTNFISYVGKKLESFGNMLTSFVQGAIDFVMFIPRKIMSGFSFIATAVSDFVTTLPDRIMNAVKNLFSPITDFFSTIGTRIKEAINGIIDSLPFPDFVKDKMKFDIEPEKPTTNFEDTLPAKHERFFEDVSSNKGNIKKFSEATGYTLNLQKTKAMYNTDNDSLIFDKNDGTEKSYHVDPRNFNVQEEIDFVANPQKFIKGGFRVRPADLGPQLPNQPSVVVTRGGDTQTISNVAKTDYNNVALNVNVDNYHDRLSVATF